MRRGLPPIILAALGLLAVVIALALLNIDRTPSAEAGAANLRSLGWLWGASALGWLGLTWLGARLARERGDVHRVSSARLTTSSGSPTSEPAPASCDSLGKPGRRPRVSCPIRASVVVLLVALAARVVVLLAHAPMLSDDVNRYAFDGLNLATSENPYLVRPEARVTPLYRMPNSPLPGERWPGEHDLVRRMNNPELHTIYLPTAQMVFGAAGAIAMATSTDAAWAVTVTRGVMIAVDVLLVALLLVILLRRGRSPWWAALYAWHPLVLAEVAGSGHQDVIGIVLLVAALLAAERRPSGADAPVARWSILLAAAALVKPIVVPIAPLMLRGRAWPAWIGSLLVGAATVVVLGAPFLLTADAEALGHLAETGRRFSLKWAHFGSVYEPLLAVIEWARPAWTNDAQEQLARVLCTLGLAAVAIVVWRRARSAWTGASAILLAMVLLTPAAHPWYLLWALALVPIAPSRTVWIASLTLPWGYAALGDPAGWTIAPWIMVAAYAPVYASLLLAAVSSARAKEAT